MRVIKCHFVFNFCQFVISELDIERHTAMYSVWGHLT